MDTNITDKSKIKILVTEAELENILIPGVQEIYRDVTSRYGQACKNALAEDGSVKVNKSTLEALDRVKEVFEVFRGLNQVSNQLHEK